MKLVFFGLPLAALLLHGDGHELLQVVLSPVPHPGRRRLARTLPADRIVDALALGDGFDGRVDLGALERADLLVSWFWTRRLPESWLARPRLGAIGSHPSLLPRHRGPDPYFGAIDCGDLETGVSVHRLEVEYDTGAVLAQQRVPIGERDAGQLARLLDRPSLGLLRATVARLACGEELRGTAQDEAQASLAPVPRGAKLRVDWSWPAERVVRRIRALSPVPGLALELLGLRLFVTRASVSREAPSALRPGEAAVLEDKVVIRTGDSGIAIERCVIEQGDELLEQDRIGLARMAAGRRQVLDSNPPSGGD